MKLSPLLALCLLPQVVFASGAWFDARPRSLQDELDRLPAKSLGSILEETAPQPGVEALDYVPLATELVANLDNKKPAAVKAGFDRLIKNARQTYTSGAWCVWLYDLQDAATTQGPPAAARDAYLKWRLAAAPVDDSNPLEAQAGTIAEHVGVVADPMRPHWLHASGARLFSTGDRTDCRAIFEQLVKEFPDHPRAESARFLIARCARSTAETDDQRAEAWALFEDYLKRYPRGRFVADTWGWLGALAWNAGDAPRALECYLKQIDDRDHPEVRTSAAFMLEQVMAHLAGLPDEENDAALKVIVRHPPLALALAYQVLNADEISPDDGKLDEAASLRAWRRRLLPRLAAQVAAQGGLYDSGPWVPRFRALLAQAASADGRQAEALKLTDVSPKVLASNDDLLLARALVLLRLRRPGEAAALFAQLEKSFPESPLIPGVRIRHALALVDLHRSGEALALLLAVPEDKRDRPTGGDYVYPPAFADLPIEASATLPSQWGTGALEPLTDAILAFAPLKELDALPHPETLPENVVERLKRTVVWRWLALENFAEYRAAGSPMDEDEADKERIAGLERATAKVNDKSGTPADQAKACEAAGDAWAAARHRVLFTTYAPGPALDNAATLGFTKAGAEFEDYDELHHASRYWMRAARLQPGTPLAARCRLRALEALRSLALATDPAWTHARRTGWDKASRELFDRLQKECPGTDEAKQAAWWTFPVPPQGTNDMDPPLPRGDDISDNELEAVQRVGGYGTVDLEAFGVTNVWHQWDDWDASAWKPLIDDVRAVESAIGTTPRPELAAKSAALAGRARALSRTATEGYLVGYLDDLSDVLAESAPPDDLLKAYVEKRSVWFDSLVDNTYSVPGAEAKDEFVAAHSGDIAVLAAADTGHTLADYLDYYRLWMDTLGGTNITDTAEDCQAFLTKHPHSRKRENAWLLTCRSLRHDLPNGWGWTYAEDDDTHRAPNWPDMPPFASVLSPNPEPLEEKSLVEALDAAAKEFPAGRYAAEFRNLRGALAWRQRDYPQALELTLAQLVDPAHPDLQPEASLRLANIFADLSIPERRPALLTALENNPAAREQLSAWLQLTTRYRQHPLKGLEGYLQERLKLTPE